MLAVQSAPHVPLAVHTPAVPIDYGAASLLASLGHQIVGYHSPQGSPVNKHLLTTGSLRVEHPLPTTSSFLYDPTLLGGHAKGLELGYILSSNHTPATPPAGVFGSAFADDGSLDLTSLPPPSALHGPTRGSRPPRPAAHLQNPHRAPVLDDAPVNLRASGHGSASAARKRSRSKSKRGKKRRAKASRNHRSDSKVEEAESDTKTADAPQRQQRRRRGSSASRPAQPRRAADPEPAPPSGLEDVFPPKDKPRRYLHPDHDQAGQRLRRQSVLTDAPTAAEFGGALHEILRPAPPLAERRVLRPLRRAGDPPPLEVRRRPHPHSHGTGRSNNYAGFGGALHEIMPPAEALTQQQLQQPPHPQPVVRGSRAASDRRRAQRADYSGFGGALHEVLPPATQQGSQGSQQGGGGARAARNRERTSSGESTESQPPARRRRAGSRARPPRQARARSRARDSSTGAGSGHGDNTGSGSGTGRGHGNGSGNRRGSGGSDGNRRGSTGSEGSSNAPRRRQRPGVAGHRRQPSDPPAPPQLMADIAAAAVAAPVPPPAAMAPPAPVPAADPVRRRPHRHGAGHGGGEAAAAAAPAHPLPVAAAQQAGTALAVAGGAEAAVGVAQVASTDPVRGIRVTSGSRTFEVARNHQGLYPWDDVPAVAGANRGPAYMGAYAGAFVAAFVDTLSRQEAQAAAAAAAAAPRAPRRRRARRQRRAGQRRAARATAAAAPAPAPAPAAAQRPPRMLHDHEAVELGMKVVVYKEAELGATNASGLADECTVCLEDFEEGDKLRQLGCGHRFHGPCIQTWLQQKPMCPTCRYDVAHGCPAQS